MKQDKARAAIRAALMTSGLLAGLAACVPTALVTGGVVAGTSLTQARSTSQQARDLRIDAEIEKRLLDASGDTFRRVGVDVFEGRALLTGTVLTQEQMTTAAYQASITSGVREVLNEIVFDPRGGDVFDYSKDVGIANNLRARLVTDGLIKHQNYDVQVNHKVVYLMGVAASQEELDRVTSIAARVPGVREVVSHALVYTDPRRQPPQPQPQQQG